MSWPLERMEPVCRDVQEEEAEAPVEVVPELVGQAVQPD